MTPDLPMLRITGGTVYDPANGIDGVVKDICIDGGRIVAPPDGADASASRTIDATGMIVFPGGVDVHTHVAGGALNFARGLVPENQRAARKFLHGANRRAGIGGMTPTTFATGYLYAGMGWTTVNEAAVPILSAKHTHEELHDTPDRRQVLSRADGQQRDRVGPDRGGRGRARAARRRVADLGRQGVRHQGRQPGRRRGVEVG